jgi:small subunit ribosomal protein S6
MPLYECVLIARNDVTQQQVEAVADGIGADLETDGGSVKKREYWGLRSLAYRVKKNRKGHYLHLNIDAPASAMSELERTQRINEDVLRYLTVRVEAHEEGPSAVMQAKSSREERGRRDRFDR